MARKSYIWGIESDVDIDGAFAVFHRNNGAIKRFRVSPDDSMGKKLKFLKRVSDAQFVLLEGKDLTGNRKKYL